MQSSKVVLAVLFLEFLVFRVKGELTIQTSSGPVEGFDLLTFNNKTVSAFFGIPYAAPPVGSLRFKPPTPSIPSTTVISAKNKSKSCLQNLPDYDGDIPTPWLPRKDEISEDCLYLNIWVPNPKPQDAAVMVFIHGGAFMVGTSASESYDGRILAAEKGVIVVSMNYRLGVFGFLSLDSEEVPGNVGIMDQAMALRFVQNNIEAFGGNRRKVTIFGVSAGAASVGLHLVIPTSWNLFQRGILESGSCIANWCYSNKTRAAEKAKSFIDLAGCSFPDKTAIIDCLRQKDGLSLVKASAQVQADTGHIMAFSPVVDGVYLPEDPKTLLNNGQVKQSTQVLLGVTKDDGAFLPLTTGVMNMTDDSVASSEVFLKYIKSTIITNSDIIAETTKFVYTDWTRSVEDYNWRQEIVDFATDWYFTCGTNEFADLELKNENTVYRYQLDHKPSNSNFMPNWTGANHCDEAQFVFGWPLDQSLNYTSDEAGFAKTILSYWTEFAKKGDPNAEGENRWPVYTKKDKNMLILDLKITTQKGARLQTCAFIDYLLPRLQNISVPILTEIFPPRNFNSSLKANEEYSEKNFHDEM